MKKLTDKGITEDHIDGVDEIIDMEVPRKRMISDYGINNKYETKEERKKLYVVGKGTIIGIFSCIAVFLIIFAVFVIWFNISFNKKEFNPSISNNINPETNVTVNEGNNPVNVYLNQTVIIPRDFIIKIQNYTNSS